MKHLFAVATASLFAAGAIAQEAPKNMTFGTTLKSVAVFRDGFGFYVREGKVKLENGWATTNFIPSAIKGTVWVYSLDSNDRVDTVITTKENTIDFGAARDIKGKLADKMGLRLTVITNNGQSFEGELVKTLDDMIMLRNGSAFTAILYTDVRTISFVGYPIRIKINTKDPNKVVNLGFAYLQEGIRWEPSYVLEVKKGQANLVLRASMQNTTEKLDKSDVLFVVGSPFVTNRGMTDMVAMLPGAAVPTDMKDKAPGAPGAMGGVGGGGFGVPAPQTEGKAAIAAEEAGELYYYSKPGLTLSTNDIAMVTVFEATVPVTPQFEWNADGEEVTYLLSIKNSGKQPLTTGPVFVLEDGKAVGQETIKYTPAGGTAEVRLSRGIGLRVEKTEAEVKRGGAVKVGRTELIPITLKGTLTITNFRADKASVKITKTSRGRVIETSDTGKVKQTQVLTGEANPINDIEWKVSVAPGETKVITYTVEVLMSADRAGTPPVPTGPEEIGR